MFSAERKIGQARDLIDEGYHAAKYRNVHKDAAFRIKPPAWELLAKDDTLLPPKKVQGKAGHPKGQRKRKRRRSNGEFNSCSVNNTPMSASAATRSGSDGGSGAAGNSSAAVDLSQETA